MTFAAQVLTWTEAPVPSARPSCWLDDFQILSYGHLECEPALFIDRSVRYGSKTMIDRPDWHLNDDFRCIKNGASAYGDDELIDFRTMIFRHRLECADTLYIILLYKTISCERVKTERCPRRGGEEVDFRTSPEY